MSKRYHDMKKTIQEFKTFINKGNALDLAIGLVMGTAFNNVIKGLVSFIITPFMSVLTGQSFEHMFIVLKGSANYDDALGKYVLSEGTILLEYGKFITTIIDFFIVALALFFTIKVMTYFNKGIEKVKEELEDVKEKIVDVTEKLKK